MRHGEDGARDGLLRVRVALIDFYKSFQDQFATPAQYGLTNIKTPACPITGVGSDGLPTYTFPTCTSTAQLTSM